MNTLIKWPGGKSREYSKIAELIPEYKRYIEPFFGGGAVFFHMKPEQALINDISTDLILFYKFIKTKNDNFKEAIYEYEKYWSNFSDYINSLFPYLCDIYIKYRLNSIIDDKELKNIINQLLISNRPLFDKLFDENFTINNDNFTKEIYRTLTDKIIRMKELEIKKQSPLCDKDVKDNIETGFRSGFYMHFRNIYNDILLNRNEACKLSLEKKTANFYFIREYCYGSMFRYNSKGEFNIPYGGISYNKKDFKRKVDNLFKEDIGSLFLNTTLYNLDFEEFFNNINLNEKDFIFLDPPYDSDFSDYESKVFDQNDQKRLASFLYFTKAKFILIIKLTKLIWDLYNNKKKIKIIDFDKQYTYNVRSRNNRDVTHLIITNINNGFSSVKYENLTFD